MSAPEYIPDYYILVNYLHNKQFITWQQALEMQSIPSETPLLIADLHVHSSFSYDGPKNCKPNRIIKKAIKSGYTHVALTDHETDQAWQSTRKHNNRIRGIELLVTDTDIGHPFEFNFLNCSDRGLEKILKAQKNHNAYGAVNEALKDGATVIANHPWYPPSGYTYDKDNYWSLVNDFKLPVELNHSRNWIENLLTLYYSVYYDIPLVASSDNHTSTPSKIATVARGKTIDEFLDNVSKGDSYMVFSSIGLLGQPGKCNGYMREIFDSEEPSYRNPGRDFYDSLIHNTERTIKNYFPKKSMARDLAEYTVYLFLGAGSMIHYPFEIMGSIKRAAF